MPKKTPLYDWHFQHGAKLVEFGGWLMPVSYVGVLREHQAVREACGLFDVSHMGEIHLEGPQAEAYLQEMASNDVSRLQTGEAQYALLLNEAGRPLDDIIIYRLAPQSFMLCVNASNTEKDREWLQRHLRPGVRLEDRSAATGMIALQGPQSAPVLRQLVADAADLPRFHCRFATLAGTEVLLARTGYTGEDGFEIFLPAERLAAVWEALLQAGAAFGIQAVGLGARDTLRLEMGYPLYGHELSENISPLEAGLNWVVKWDKGNFLGREALLQEKAAGLTRRLIGLVMEEPGIPREGLTLYRGGEAFGTVLSGTFSPSLQRGVATALVKREAALPGEEIFIDIRGKMKKAKLASLPFLKKKN